MTETSGAKQSSASEETLQSSSEKVDILSDTSSDDLSDEVSELEELIEERKKSSYNAKVNLTFTVIWTLCLAAKIYFLK